MRSGDWAQFPIPKILFQTPNNLSKYLKFSLVKDILNIYNKTISIVRFNAQSPFSPKKKIVNLFIY